MRRQPLSGGEGGSRAGFTLVELLISMAVLMLLVVFVTQVTTQINMAVQLASKQLDIASQARTVLDRLGNNLGNLMVAQGVAPVVVKDTSEAASGRLNDGLAFFSNSRVRPHSAASSSFIRMGLMGYRVTSQRDLILGGDVPMMTWGDGTITWSTGGGAVQNASKTKSNLTTAMQTAAADLANNSQDMVDFQVIGQGIIRFEVCFLRDDGRIVSTPPADVNFPPSGNTYSVALSKAVSADPNGRYVKAFIIGIAGLDTQTRQLVGAKGSNLKTLADALPNPTASDQTPLQAWDFTTTSTAAGNLRNTLTTNFPPPVIQSLRLYQRYYYVNNAQ